MVQCSNPSQPITLERQLNVHEEKGKEIFFQIFILKKKSDMLITKSKHVGVQRSQLSQE
jgi:hypothetical protein